MNQDGDGEGQMAQRVSLFVKKISIQGFKSFKSRAKIGPLSHFSCVIGPNGAGKSVVGEALAFVLGCSAKDMRAKCLAGLVNEDVRNSGDKVFCKVSVTLEDSERHLVKISRVITGTTGSYLWSSNGIKRKISFDEMRQELLCFGIGIDISERFIIMQSKQAIKAKQPSELCEYLEVIFGAGHLKAMILEIEKEICAKGNETIMLHEELVAVQSNIEKLRPEVEKWQIFDHQWRNFQSRKISYLHAQENSLKRKLIETSTERNEKLNAYHNVKESKASVQDLQIKANAKASALKTTLEQKKRALGESDKRVLESRMRMIKAQVRLNVAKEEAERKRQEYSNLHQQQEALRKDIEYLSTNLNELRDQRNALIHQRKEAEEQKPSILYKDVAVAEAEAFSSVSVVDIEDIFERILAAENACKAVNFEVERYKADAITLKKEIDVMERQCFEIGETKRERELHELQVKKELDATLQESERVCSCILALKEMLRKNEFELHNLKKKLLGFEKVVAKDPKEDSAVDYLKKELEGRFYGRVTDLAMVKDGMSIAVNAVVAHLINTSKTFVTEDRETANVVITFFKHHKIGVATCEILRELSELYQRSFAPPKQGDGKPAMDYIHCEGRFVAVFWKYLKNWVIFEDRDAVLMFLNGRRNAHLPDNIVTLRGEIFKQDGEVISTVGHALRTYTLQDHDNHKSITNANIWNSEIKTYEERVRSLSERQLLLREQVVNNECGAAKLEKQARELQIQLKNIQGQEVDTLSLLSSRLEEKKKLYSDLHCKIEDLEIRASKLKINISELHDLENSLMSSEMVAWQKKIETLSADIRSCDSEIRMKTSKMKSIKKKLNGLDFLGTEVRTRDAQLVEAEHYYALTKEQLQKETLHNDKLLSDIDKISESLTETIQLLDGYKKQVGTLQGKEVELKSQLDRLADYKSDLNEKISQIRRALPENFKDVITKRALPDVSNAIDFSHMGVDGGGMEGMALAEEELSLKDLYGSINPLTLEEDLTYRKRESQLIEKLENLENTLDSLKLKKEMLENERYATFTKSVKNVCIHAKFRVVF
ncbi:hypothetical protein KP509_06G010700 [Ceratopteris richardii]|uniref:Structural maintenance of chromosomes protein n=2 Tax=Ceratopteris richardii TaxID=49495 RepID=A0A8T2UI06_CERRI|nr:hypothetical protein KP509_06G010700 [Ceratopteris richardii]